MPNKDIHGLEEAASPKTPKGKNYLLAIGIDQYAHCPRLHNAVKDAKDIVNVLKKRFRFDAENIIELYDLEATKRNIYTAFRKMAEKVSSADNLLIYFSGHGEFDKIFRLGYWIPIEAEKNAVDQYVPNSEIRNILSAIKSHHTFLMVDSCFSGVLFAKNAGRNVSLRKERDPSRWGLTAGRNEIVTDGERGTNSPFAKSILYQLENTDKPLGVAELCDKVLEVVSANANQTPRGEPLKVDGHQGGQFVFHLKKDEVADWKEATATGTLQSYQSFLGKYPDGRFTSEANTKIKQIKANALWQQIAATGDTDIGTLNKKLRLVNQYVTAYHDQPNYEETLDIGEFLEYKKQFLQTKTSEYALRRFLGKPTPNVPGGAEIKAAAEGLLAMWDKPIVEEQEDGERKAEAARRRTEETAQREAVARKKQEEEEERREEEARRRKEQEEDKRRTEEKGAVLSDEPASREKEEARRRTEERDKLKKEPVRLHAPAKPKTARPVSHKQKDYTELPFIKKYRKYLIALLLLPLLIWGIVQIIPDNSQQTILSTEMKMYQDETTQLWGFKKGSVIAIPAGYDSVTDFKNGESEVVKDGHPFTINEKGECIKDCPAAFTTTNSGTITHGGQSYRWLRLKDGKKWMTENLNYEVSGTWCYDNSGSNCKKYGRLYTWEAAKKACPSGWHLPSDSEWKALASAYGGYYDYGSSKDVGDPQAGYKALTNSSNSSFSALLGGGRGSDGSFYDLGGYGFYWSSTEQSSYDAWYYYFYLSVYPGLVPQALACPVRRHQSKGSSRLKSALQQVPQALACPVEGTSRRQVAD